MLYFNLEDYKQEIQYFEVSLSIAKEMGKRDEEEVLYADLGFSYKNLKDYKQAIQYFELALSILEEIGDKDQERLTNKELTGECYFYLKDYKQAIHSFELCLKNPSQP